MLSFGRRVFVSSALVACAFAAMATEAHAQSSSLVGQRLGRNGSGQEVKVTREVGSGYTTRWQASAAARMTGSEAVVVKTRDGKWHACATTANALHEFKPADYSGIAQLVPLTSPAQLGTLAKPLMTDDLASVFGVDKRDVMPRISDNRSLSGFINVPTELPYPGMHGPEGTLDNGFKLGGKTAIQIDRRNVEKKDARFTAAVLFHETAHMADYELAQQWAEKFSRETKQPVIPSFVPKGKPIPFVEWITDKRRSLQPDDARMIAETVLGAHNSTEARAYIATFIAALQAGAGDVATTQLVTYAKTDAVQIEPHVVVQNALSEDLDKAYASLDAKGKKDFEAAFAAAKAASSGAWISKYKRGAGRRS